MHDPVETTKSSQQHEQHANDPLATLALAAEEKTAAAASELAALSERLPQTGNETGTGNNTGGDVDQNGTETGGAVEAMDSTKMQDYDGPNQEGAAAEEGTDERSENAQKSSSGGVSGAAPQDRGGRPEAVTATQEEPDSVSMAQKEESEGAPQERGAPEAAPAAQKEESDSVKAAQKEESDSVKAAQKEKSDSVAATQNEEPEGAPQDRGAPEAVQAAQQQEKSEVAASKEEPEGAPEAMEIDAEEKSEPELKAMEIDEEEKNDGQEADGADLKKEEAAPQAMEVDGGDAGENDDGEAAGDRNDADKSTSEEKESVDREKADKSTSESEETKKDGEIGPDAPKTEPSTSAAATEDTNANESSKPPTVTGTGNDSAAVGSTSGSGGATAGDGGNAAAAAPATPPPPVLKGTLSYNVELKRHVIRGMWNYENSNAFPPQRFELLRNLNVDEDPTELPKDGEFHGSFSLAYYHTTSKGKRKERSKVIPESGVNIKFTKIEGKEKEYKVDGQGTNQFGIFHINGTATPSMHEGDPSYNIELRKRYAPSQTTTQPDGSENAAVAGADSSKKGKKSKKRKHSLLGTSANGDDDDDSLRQMEQDDGPLPPPSQLHPSRVICLQGKLSREQSDDLGVTEVVHKISGMWSSGLDLIVADPQNIRGLCNKFEYEHKSTVPSDVFPISGRYAGWFDLTQADGSRKRVQERDVTLKFRKNNAGYHNVEGRGSNPFGKYKISGTLSEDNVITIFRHFQPIKAKKKEDGSGSKAGSVTAAPPPLKGSSRAGKQQSAQAPTYPVITLDEVVAPGDAKPDDPLQPIPPPEHGTYSVVSRGVLRLNDDGAITCAGKWAMTREHYNNGQTSNFHFRLEPHFAAEAAAAMKKATGDGKAKDADKESGSASAVAVSPGSPGTATFPLDSALYKGSFQMRRGATKYTSIIDQQIVLKFRENTAGSYNVYGKGVNSIGAFTLVGTLILSGKSSGHVELYRVYPVPPKPAVAPGSAVTGGKSLPTSKRQTSKDTSSAQASSKPVDGIHSSTVASGIVPGTSTMLPGPPRSGLLRRESSRLVKLPSRLEEDDPEAQIARIMDKCVHVLRSMREKDVEAGAFFSEPVDPVAHGIPTYHQIISEPMDLGTIQRKMDAKEIKTPEEFARLVRLVFENAMKFNVEPTHVVHGSARGLLILFNQKFRDVERMIENVRRLQKPTEAELREAEREKKRKEKDEAKKAKRLAKEERKRKRSSLSPKKSRLEEAQAMAAANASAMAAVVAAAPSNAAAGGNVTRAEFNLMLQMIQQLQSQMVQTHTLLATVSSSVAVDDAASAGAGGPPEAELAYSAPSQRVPSATGPEKKRPAKKKSDSYKAEEIPSLEDEKPLTLKEQETLTDTINRLPPERLPGVIQIIRESTHLNGDEDEIDLEIDQLDTTTQRKLQRYVLKYVKPPRRPKAKPATKKARTTPTPSSQSKKNDTKGVAPASSSAKPKSVAQPKPAPNSFFAFGSKGDSDSESDSESDAGAVNRGEGGKELTAPNDQFDLGEGFALHEEDDDELGNGGIAANWNMSKPVTQSAPKDDGDDGGKDLWGAAQKKAERAKARDAERKALEDKIIAEAEIAKTQRLKDAAARGDEIRAQRLEDEANEARLREQQEQEAEDARKAARDAARAKVQAVEQTVDLDAQRDIMKQYEQSFLDKELGGSASPSSDFGF